MLVAASAICDRNSLARDNTEFADSASLCDLWNQRLIFIFSNSIFEIEILHGKKLLAREIGTGILLVVGFGKGRQNDVDRRAQFSGKK